MEDSKCPMCGYAKPDREKIILTIRDILNANELAYEMEQQGDYLILKISNLQMLAP